MIERAIGRLLVIGFEQSAWDERLAELLREVQPGGVIFYRRNTAGGEEGFRELVGRVRETLAPGAFLAADLEGGTVDALADLVGPFPSAHSATEAHDDPLLRRMGELAGEALRAFGLNTNLAPVMDLAPLSGVLGTRAASAAPGEVLRFARNFLEGLSRSCVLGCGKHFPGLGGATVDTHTELAVVERDSDKLSQDDLLPFRGLASELPLVMVGHAFYPALEPPGTAPRPAIASPEIVTGLLREKLGFRGLILSDDLEMGGALAGRTIGEAAIGAVESGCQLLLVCHRAENIRAVRRALLDLAGREPAFGGLVRGVAREVEAFAAQRLGGPAWEPAPTAELRRRISGVRETVEGMEALHLLPLGTSGMAPARRGRPPGGRPGGGGRGRGRGERGEGRRRGPRREDGEGRPGGPPRGGRGPRGPRRGPPRSSL